MRIFLDWFLNWRFRYLGLSEGLKLRTVWRIHRFSDPENLVAARARKGVSIDALRSLFSQRFLGVDEIVGNLGLNEGLAELLDLAFGLGSPTAFDDENGYIGVGDDGTTSENATQTGLLAVTNKTYVVFDENYPGRANQTVTVRATFGAGVGTHAWKEFTVANGGSNSAKNLNRKIADKGTKAAGETWIAEVQITVS